MQPNLAPSFAHLLLEAEYPHLRRLSFRVPLARLPVELARQLGPAPTTLYPPPMAIISSWKRQQNGYQFTLRGSWNTDLSATVSEGEALQLAEAMLKARTEQQRGGPDQGYTQHWSSGWRYMAQEDGRFFDAVGQCWAFGRILIYLGGALDCDTPILEAVWCAWPAYCKRV